MQRSYLPEVKELLRLKEELKEESLPAGAYCRLSHLDGEADTIETQVQMVESYIRENPEIHLTDTYIDNGFSGTSFDRPEWNRLIKDVQTGRISCIVVKDLSRLGRSYVEAGTYMNEIFPKLGIRFISINDNYDSDMDDPSYDLILPLKNVLNSMYAKDTGRKVKGIVRREETLEDSRQPRYGYVRQGKKLIENPEETQNVKLIFAWAKLGNIPEEIKNRLNLIGIPTPEKKTIWNVTSVRQILSNRIYQAEGGIIDPEDFEEVQKKLKERGFQNGKAESKHGAYQGKIYCSVCGKPLIYSSLKSAKDSVYFCNKHFGTNTPQNALAERTMIKEGDACRKVKRMARSYLNDLKNAKQIVMGMNRQGGLIERISLKALYALAEKKSVEEEGERMIEEFQQGGIRESSFIERRKLYRERLSTKKKHLHEILYEQRRLRSRYEELLALCREAENINHNDLQQISQYVEKITCYPGGILRITFRDHSVIKALLEKGEEGILK